MVGDVRRGLGRDAKTTFLIVDAQSVKNTDTAEQKGFDAGKKVSGIKRHIGVDTNGIPHAIHITTANVTDRAGALAMFAACKDNLTSVIKVLADGGYTGGAFASSVLSASGASVEIAKRNELHKFAVIPKRWVVERSFAWLDKCPGFGKTPNVNSTPASIWLFWLSLLFFSKDHEQALKLRPDVSRFGHRQCQGYSKFLNKNYLYIQKEEPRAFQAAPQR